MAELRRRRLTGPNARAINRNDIQQMSDTEYAAAINGTQESILRLEREILTVQEKIDILRAQMEQEEKTGSGAGTSTAPTTEVRLMREIEYQLRLQQIQEELCRSLPRAARQGLPCGEDEDLFSEDEGDDGEEGEEGGDDADDDGDDAMQGAIAQSFADARGAESGQGSSNTNAGDP